MCLLVVQYMNQRLILTIPLLTMQRYMWLEAHGAEVTKDGLMTFRTGKLEAGWQEWDGAWQVVVDQE